MFENIPEGGWGMIIFGIVAILTALKAFTPIFEIMLGKKSQIEKIKAIEKDMAAAQEAERACLLKYDELKKSHQQIVAQNSELDLKYSNVFAFAVSMEQAVKDSGFATLKEFLEKLNERP